MAAEYCQLFSIKVRVSLPWAFAKRQPVPRWSATIMGEMKAYDELEHKEQKLRIEWYV